MRKSSNFYPKFALTRIVPFSEYCIGVFQLESYKLSFNCRSDGSTKWPKVVEKVVVMVIDGLRSDHIFLVEKNLDTGDPITLSFSDSMPYLKSVLSTEGGNKQKTYNSKGRKPNGGLAFEMITSSPTVTYPRLMVCVQKLLQ